MWGTQLLASATDLDAWPDLSALGNEVVVRIDHQEPGDVFVLYHGNSVLRWSEPFCKPVVEGGAGWQLEQKSSYAGGQWKVVPLSAQ
jgi:hypothetical protein